MNSQSNFLDEIQNRIERAKPFQPEKISGVPMGFNVVGKMTPYMLKVIGAQDKLSAEIDGLNQDFSEEVARCEAAVSAGAHDQWDRLENLQAGKGFSKEAIKKLRASEAAMKRLNKMRNTLGEIIEQEAIDAFPELSGKPKISFLKDGRVAWREIVSDRDMAADFAEMLKRTLGEGVNISEVRVEGMPEG